MLNVIINELFYIYYALIEKKAMYLNMIWFGHIYD